MIQKLKHWLVRALEWALIIAVTALVLDVVWGVITRYVFGSQANWSEELARFLLIWVALLGGALAFGKNAHLGVDYFVGQLDPAARKLMSAVVHLIVLFFSVAVFVYGGGRIVADALTLEQMTPALGWKMGYVYLALPISGAFMIIFTLENLIETLKGSAQPQTNA